jgi:hypothetical protein
MKHVPSSLLGYVNISGKLATTDSLFMGGHNEDRMEPLLQGQSRIFKYSPNFHREWLSAFRAFKKLAALNLIYLFGIPAIDTDGNISPSGLNKKLSARFFGREAFDKLQEVVDRYLFESGFHCCTFI